jgi:hypothetical protein
MNFRKDIDKECVVFLLGKPSSISDTKPVPNAVKRLYIRPRLWI